MSNAAANVVSKRQMQDARLLYAHIRRHDDLPDVIAYPPTGGIWCRFKARTPETASESPRPRQPRRLQCPGSPYGQARLVRRGAPRDDLQERNLHREARHKRPKRNIEQVEALQHIGVSQRAKIVN